MFLFMSRRYRHSLASEWKPAASAALLAMDDFRARHCIVREEWKPQEVLAFLHWTFSTAVIGLRLGARSTEVLLADLATQATGFVPEEPDPAAEIITAMGEPASRLPALLCGLNAPRAVAYEKALQSDRESLLTSYPLAEARLSHVQEAFIGHVCGSDVARLICDRAAPELDGIIQATLRRSRHALARA